MRRRRRREEKSNDMPGEIDAYAERRRDPDVAPKLSFQHRENGAV